jgi:hypothetical protein
MQTGAEGDKLCKEQIEQWLMEINQQTKHHPPR